MIGPFESSPQRFPAAPSFDSPCDLLVTTKPASPQVEKSRLALETLNQMGQTLEAMRVLMQSAHPQDRPLVSTRSHPETLSELDRDLSAMTQRLIDLLGDVMPAVNEALAFFAPHGDTADSKISAKETIDRLPPLPTRELPAIAKEGQWVSILKTREFTEDGHPFVNGLRGAFIALRSDSGDFEVQKLHGSPLLDPQGIYNVAVAVKVNGDVVQFDARDHSLRLNGVRIPRKEGMIQLPHGGTLQVQGSKLIVTSPLGDHVAIGVGSVAEGSFSHTLNLQGSVSADRPPHSVKGALGVIDRDGQPENDFVMRDGRHVSTEDGLKFLESWRVPPEETLFSVPNKTVP